MTTAREISVWFDRGLEQKATHMIVVCDTFDWDDYPVYVKTKDDVREIAEKYDGKEMQIIMEVYNLGLDKASQLAEVRAFHY